MLSHTYFMILLSISPLRFLAIGTWAMISTGALAESAKLALPGLILENRRQSSRGEGAEKGDLPPDNPGAAEQFAVGPEKPYQTISSALADMKDGDICLISAGVYRERLDVRQNNITLRGEGHVVITGLDAAGEMESFVVNGHKGLRKTVGLPVYDVFHGGQYLMPARYPNKTSPMTSNEDWEESFIGTNGNVGFRNQAQKTFPELSDGYYVGVHGSFRGPHGLLSTWHSISLPITGIGKTGFISVNAEEASSGFMGTYGQGKGLGYIIGAKAVLDAPGEWYSDSKEVLLIPPSGGAGNYEFRTRLYGAVIEGNGVCLENLQFKAATARVHGDDVIFSKCSFEYISPFRHNPNDIPQNKQGQSLFSSWGNPENGTAGVFVDGDRFVAENCRFSKSWWSGMTIRGNKARIENCLFEDMNWIARRSAGLFSWGNHNTVRYSTFRNLGASAIEGGNGNWIKQYAKNNIWEYNEIENVCQLVVDQGFFYVNHQDGMNPKANSVWRYNVGKGSRGPVKGDWKRTTVGFYVDNSSSGYRIHNNIVIDATEAIRYNDTRDGPRAGKDIWFYNNTFYKCDSIAFAHWNRNGLSKADAMVMLINNLALPEGSLDFKRWGKVLKWRNNLQSLPASVLENPDTMDFTPTQEKLKTGGVPVHGQKIPYIGAVDPEKGMWRYGAGESKLHQP